MHFIARGENGQLRARIVQIDSVLTVAKVVGWFPEVFAISGQETGRETKGTIPP